MGVRIVCRYPMKPILCGIVVLFVLTIITFHCPILHVPRAIRQRGLLPNIYNNTLGFEKIFVVGLPSRSDRRDGIALQASLSNMDIEFIDGPSGKEVAEKAIPKFSDHARLDDGVIGCWRAHMNALREIVRLNLTSALILEDDTDWDIRIRDQLRDFALAAQALIQPLHKSSLADDDFWYTPRLQSWTRDESIQTSEMTFGKLPATVAPKVSPYGDDWDLLWIGHCGMHFPFEDGPIPKGRVIHFNDQTVPKKDHLWTLNIPFTLKEKYPNHTRAIHHVQEGVCSLGYAVSYRGALKLLHEVGLKDVSDPYDILLRYFCEGARGMRSHKCLTLQPALFHHHRPAGAISAQSNIGDHGAGYNKVGRTDMVRWSVRLNVDVLADGGTDFKDQFPE